MQRHRFAHPGGQHITEAIPDVPPLTHFGGGQALLAKFEVDGPQTRPIVPQHLERLRQLGEVLQCVPVLRFVGTIEPDHDLFQVRHFCQLLDNVFQGGAFQL